MLKKNVKNYKFVENNLRQPNKLSHKFDIPQTKSEACIIKFDGPNLKAEHLKRNSESQQIKSEKSILLEKITKKENMR
jgi:hypothetical protein